MFLLTGSSAPSLLLPNVTSNGFMRITIADSGVRIYRITRERRSPSSSSLDYFDFSIDFSTYTSGLFATISIPYLASLFKSYTSGTQPAATPYDLTQLSGTQSRPDVFTGEIFKLLYISTTASDPAREAPATINFLATYSIAGLTRKVQFIYFTMVSDGLVDRPIFTGYFGNVAFDGQYAPSTSQLLTIDPTKLVNVMPIGDIDYYIVKITATPNMIITNGISRTMLLNDTYTINGITYTLTATANGLKGIGFYVILSIVSPFDPSLPEYGFSLEPATSIVSSMFTKLTDTSYQFLIKPAPRVTSMDLKISFTGPTH